MEPLERQLVPDCVEKDQIQESETPCWVTIYKHISKPKGLTPSRSMPRLPYDPVDANAFGTISIDDIPCGLRPPKDANISSSVGSAGILWEVFAMK